ncbi:MAG TPA: hypothetical protein VGR53_11500 [Nitrososphaerales archaeon]|nr:hypothetical protein [Nitrososphaerales archaeon]
MPIRTTDLLTFNIILGAFRETQSEKPHERRIGTLTLGTQSPIVSYPLLARSSRKGLANPVEINIPLNINVSPLRKVLDRTAEHICCPMIPFIPTFLISNMNVDIVRLNFTIL